MKYKTIACLADNTDKAKEACAALSAKYDIVPEDEADVIVALGGDGFMLQVLHKYIDCEDKLFYGMNCGTVGFLLNEYRDEGLLECINEARLAILHPLRMIVKAKDGSTHEALAINEVSMLRQSRQAASLKISIDQHVRMENLSCDGVLVATPAGSTAYNLSVHGPILPMSCDILALTPISPFRPRRWRGALLSKRAKVTIEVLEPEKRPVSAVADSTEVRDVVAVEVFEDRTKNIKLMFDHGHSLEERIIREQFM